MASDHFARVPSALTPAAAARQITPVARPTPFSFDPPPPPAEVALLDLGGAGAGSIDLGGAGAGSIDLGGAAAGSIDLEEVQDVSAERVGHGAGRPAATPMSSGDSIDVACSGIRAVHAELMQVVVHAFQHQAGAELKTQLKAALEIAASLVKRVEGTFDLPLLVPEIGQLAAATRALSLPLAQACGAGELVASIVERSEGVVRAAALGLGHGSVRGLVSGVYGSRGDDD